MQHANAIHRPAPGRVSRLFRRTAAQSDLARQRLHNIAGSPAAERAAEMLSAPSAAAA
jgi:hypothetical protein